MRMQALEQSASVQLDTPLIIARADPDMDTGLSEAERSRLAAITKQRRRRSWLTGRNALKQVLAALSLGNDTSAISFPDCRVSLTHSGDLAFAAGTPARVAGIGIDFERPRRINPKIARWFLNEDEMAWVDRHADRSTVLLRLWTAKEAAFKSHPGNAGMLLKDFSIVDPNASVLEAVTDGAGGRIRIAASAWTAGFLAVAVFPEQG